MPTTTFVTVTHTDNHGCDLCYVVEKTLKEHGARTTVTYNHHENLITEQWTETLWRLCTVCFTHVQADNVIALVDRITRERPKVTASGATQLAASICRRRDRR